MKNVSILNFWWMDNYGALLTAYCGLKLINDLCYNACLIDNSYKFNKKLREKFAINFWKQYLVKSKPCLTFDDFYNLNKQSQIFITGSDQIFRPKAAKHRLYQYLQDFSTPSAKKIAFSASFAVDKKTLEEETDSNILERMKISLKSFDFISVREKSGVEICKDLFDVDAEWIIDPVFILDKSNYEELIKKSTQDFSNKVVSYVLDPNNEYKKVYNFIEKKYNKKIIKTAYSNISVENWLTSIKNCEFLITDSFHGMCFAIIFNKPFICITNPKRGATRFESILEMLGIENQCINNITEIYEKDCIFKMNYEKINQKIAEEAQKGLDFLQKALDAPIGKKEEKIEAKIKFLEKTISDLQRNSNIISIIKKYIINLFFLIYCNLPILLQKKLKMLIGNTKK